MKAINRSPYILDSVRERRCSIDTAFISTGFWHCAQCNLIGQISQRDLVAILWQTRPYSRYLPFSNEQMQLTTNLFIVCKETDHASG